MSPHPLLALPRRCNLPPSTRVPPQFLAWVLDTVWLDRGGNQKIYECFLVFQGSYSSLRLLPPPKVVTLRQLPVSKFLFGVASGMCPTAFGLKIQSRKKDKTVEMVRGLERMKT